MNNYIRQIQQEKKACVFLSPHFDDAVLSCGQLLCNLSGKVALTVINIFTAAHAGPYTISARKFLANSGNYRSATTLFADREKEDKNALNSLNVSITNLGFQDALFRRKRDVSILGEFMPEVDHVYPTYRWHMQDVHADDTVAQLLTEKLASFSSANSIVFAPYAIGKHVDHQIVRMVAEELFDQIVYYVDFPYFLREEWKPSEDERSHIHNLFVDMPTKTRLIAHYKTQFDGLFETNHVPVHEEFYIVPKKV